MKARLIVHGLLAGMLCMLAYIPGYAQNENTRAANWLRLQRLTQLASLDSSFLSQSDKKAIYALTAVASPTAACSKASASPCPSSPLPVTGLKLTGTRSSPATVKLNWETKAEYNSKGFILERRSLTNITQFDSIYYTDGQGNSLGTTKYNYTDQNSNSVTTYYRVREVDIDEKFTYSNTVAIEGANSGLAVLVAPNPGSSSSAAFYIVGSSTLPTSFIITNATGATIGGKERLTLSGNTYVPLGSFHLHPGIYIVTVYNDKDRISEKFIIY